MNQGIKKTMLTELKIFLLCFFRRLQSIEKERAPQVLAIRYSDEEEGDDDDEEEGFGGVRSEESSDEESEEERHGDSLDTASPDSSFLSLSPGEHLLTDQTWENLRSHISWTQKHKWYPSRLKKKKGSY